MKKAYRKKALELHPDRNYGDVEAATKQFADVQSAYEILSDPQERAWYDAHRDSLLRGSNINGEHHENNVRVTTAEEVVRFFSQISGPIDFSSSPTGFYCTLSDLFDKLAREEDAACKWEGLEPIQYPSFGHKDDPYEDVVRPFYTMWSGFATRKSFSWKNLYRYSEASDRKTRRMTEKENKQLRDEGIREFNDAVRSLVAFVRKRDPRFKPNKQSEADRQKGLRDAAAAQAARSRAANEAKITEEVVPEWTRANDTDPGELPDDEWAESSPAKQEVECLVCNKSFRSEKSYEAHERSKKHIKAVQQLRRQMQREDRDFNFNAPGMTLEPLIGVVVDDTDNLCEDIEGNEQDHLTTECNQNSLGGSVSLDKGADQNSGSSPKLSVEPGGPESDKDEDEDEDYAPQKDFEQRLVEGSESVGDGSALQNTLNEPQVDALAEKLMDTCLSDLDETTTKSKLGKAKEKRAKKAVQKSSLNAGSEAEPRCNACQEDFHSKTRLFDHIKMAGHAQPVEKATKGRRGRRG